MKLNLQLYSRSSANIFDTSNSEIYFLHESAMSSASAKWNIARLTLFHYIVGKFIKQSPVRTFSLFGSKLRNACYIRIIKELYYLHQSHSCLEKIPSSQGKIDAKLLITPLWLIIEVTNNLIEIIEFGVHAPVMLARNKMRPFTWRKKGEKSIVNVFSLCKLPSKEEISKPGDIDQ